jgi:hypothetical protein
MMMIAHDFLYRPPTLSALLSLVWTKSIIFQTQSSKKLEFNRDMWKPAQGGDSGSRANANLMLCCGRPNIFF